MYILKQLAWGIITIIGTVITLTFITSYVSDASTGNANEEVIYAEKKVNAKPTTAAHGVYKGAPQEIVSFDLMSKPFTFAGEQVPVQHPDVYERLDLELLRNTYWHSNTILCIKRARQLFPIIEPILAENGIPDDLKYLAVAESALTNATSPAGAKGIWQFMQGTGKEHGLEINKEVDERLNLEMSTRAACKYLKASYNNFGSWAYAASSYNMGSSGLRSAISKQRANSYYDLNINQETMRYYFRIVALKEILENPETYGFYIDPAHNYEDLTQVTTIPVQKSIANLGDFANKYGISYRTLKRYNPWLITDKLTCSGRKVYYIRIPTNK